MIFYSIILAALVLLLVAPLIIRNIIKRSIDYFDFKLGNFNSFRDILAMFPYDSDPIIQRIAIQIPIIRISFQNRRFLLKINQFKLYLDLKVVELQVDKLTVAIIENKDYQPIQEFKQEKTQKEITQMFKLFSTNRRYKLTLPEFTFSTSINKLSSPRQKQPMQSLMVRTKVFQHEEVRENILKNVFLTLILNDLDFLFSKERKIENRKDIVLDIKTQHDEKLEFAIKSKSFYADLKNDFTKKLDRCVTIEGPQVNFQMPFGFTSDDCMNGSKIYISAKSVDCELSPATCTAYKYIKYFRAYQARLLKFIRNDLVGKEKPSRSPMPKLVDISIPSVKVKFIKLDNEISDQDGFLHGEKCNEVKLQLENVQVQVITRLHEYIIVKEIVEVGFSDMNINALIPYKDPITLCHFQKGEFYTCRDYELKTLKVLKTVDKFDQQNSEIHIHPIVFQLYEAYININQRPYLEFDFELYKTCLQKYIEECKKKYLYELKLVSPGSQWSQGSNPSSNAQTPQQNNYIQGSQNQVNQKNQSANNISAGVNNILQKEIKLLDYLIIDDKILLETILNTENVLEKVSIPYLEQEFKTDFVEMYSYCGDSKISLTSKKPRFFSIQKEENQEYQGTTEYTFNNLLLEKQNALATELLESIFTMDSFSYDIQENNEISLCKSNNSALILLI